jgi:hypothetical protein
VLLGDPASALRLAPAEKREPCLTSGGSGACGETSRYRGEKRRQRGMQGARGGGVRRGAGNKGGRRAAAACGDDEQSEEAEREGGEDCGRIGFFR